MPTPAPAPRPLTRGEVDRRIAELRARSVPCRTSRENLDCELDPRIRVDRRRTAATLVLVVDGVDASWATVVDFRQRVGAAEVRMGGIAGVGTRDDCRFRGYSKLLLENSLRWMRSEGYHTTMLYGIPSYYPKFGYAKAFPDSVFTVSVRNAEAAEADGIRFVPFEPGRHLPAVLRMFAANNAERTGVTLRDKQTWNPFGKGLHWGTEAIAEVAVDERDRPAGYIVFHKDHGSAIVLETGFVNPKVFPALLKRAAEFAWDRRLQSVRFHLPADDLFMDCCRRYGVQLEVNCPADGGAMVRMIHVRECLAAVAPVLAARMAGDAGALTLRTNLGDAALAWSDGDLRVTDDAPPKAPVARMPQWALAQLLYGYRDPRTLAAAGDIKAPAKAVADLGRLFPPHPHYHYRVDHF